MTAVRDGIVVDQAGVAAALKGLLSGAGIDANAVVSRHFSGNSVIVRHVKMPRKCPKACCGNPCALRPPSTSRRR